jgi:Zn-dependent peptidase ImmA (M78 family)
MYRIILRNRYIFVNSSLPDYMAQIVCAHELGHDRLHRNIATGDILGENSLFDIFSRAEYEANVFAAELLISDSDILPLISEKYSAEEIAAKLGTDVNLVALKIETLADAGYNLRTADRENDFLK